MRRVIHTIQASRPWRAAGFRLVGRAISVRRAVDAPDAAFRGVYGTGTVLFRPAVGTDARQDERCDAARRREVAWLAHLGRLGVGGMLLAPFDHGLFLSTMRVRWPFRRCGVATALVTVARREARRRQVPIWLVVAASNRAAVALYRGTGFEDHSGPAPVDRPGHITMRCDPRCEDRARVARSADESGAGRPAE